MIYLGTSRLFKSMLGGFRGGLISIEFSIIFHPIIYKINICINIGKFLEYSKNKNNIFFWNLNQFFLSSKIEKKNRKNLTKIK